MIEAGNIQLPMLAMLLIWISLVVLIIRRTSARGSVGMPAALALTMTFMYGGCFVYAVPEYTHLRTGGNPYLLHQDFTEAAVLKGTFVSLLALLGLTLGSGKFFRLGVPRPSKRFCPPQVERSNARGLLAVLGMLTLLSYGLGLSGVEFPMSDAALEVGRNMALVVIVLGALFAFRRGESKAKWYLVGLLPPAYFLFGFGFMSSGFLFAMVLVGFQLAQFRETDRQNRLIQWLKISGVSMGVLSLFVTWMTFRNSIRAAIWSDETGSSLDAVLFALSNLSFFSVFDFAVLDILNIRLNMPRYIGQMIEYHQANPELRQYGATLINLPLVFLPRFVWADKPVRGGSEFITQHTNIPFSDGTTFGTGTVFELYVNFGYTGVFLGFILFGMLLGRLDRAAARHLDANHYLKFARLFVVGAVTIDPLRRPFFIVSGVVFGWILMSLLILILRILPARAHRVEASIDSTEL